MIRTNNKEIILPFFVVGVAEMDLAAMLGQISPSKKGKKGKK